MKVIIAQKPMNGYHLLFAKGPLYKPNANGGMKMMRKQLYLSA